MCLTVMVMGFFARMKQAFATGCLKTVPPAGEPVCGCLGVRCMRAQLAALAEEAACGGGGSSGGSAQDERALVAAALAAFVSLLEFAGAGGEAGEWALM